MAGKAALRYTESQVHSSSIAQTQNVQELTPKRSMRGELGSFYFTLSGLAIIGSATLTGVLDRRDRCGARKQLSKGVIQ
jgi:hypothetical protein